MIRKRKVERRNKAIRRMKLQKQQLVEQLQEVKFA